MATKTKAKTAAKKSVAHKPVATHKSAPAKAQVPKKKVEVHPKPAHPPPPAKAPVHRAAEEKPHAKPGDAHRPPVESVSLIDKKHPQKKTADGEIKKKTTVLPPISRIRASLEAPTAPPKNRNPLSRQQRPMERPQLKRLLPKPKRPRKTSFTSSLRLL